MRRRGRSEWLLLAASGESRAVHVGICRGARARGRGCRGMSVPASRVFSLMVDRLAPTVRYVSVEGPVTRIVPGTDELLREITMRYLAPEKVPIYLEFAKTELGEQVAIYLRPQRWLSADLGDWES